MKETCPEPDVKDRSSAPDDTWFEEPLAMNVPVEVVGLTALEAYEFTKGEV